MKPSAADAESAARLFLRAASLLVPAAQRADWFAEWNAELWHVSHVQREKAAPLAHPFLTEPMEFSAGAWRDASSLRVEQLHGAARWLVQPGSARRCGLMLTASTLLALLLCLCLPATRRVLLPFPYSDTANLTIIASNGDPGTRSPSIRYSDYREWTTDATALFTQLAWYRPTTKGISLPQHRSAQLALAEASDNLPLLLHLQLPTPARQNFHGARLILTRSAYRRTYRSDPNILGRIADIDGRPVLIAAVLPDRDWRLPGAIDGLLLENPSTLAYGAAGARGFAIARIRKGAFPAPRDGWRWMTETNNGIPRRFECVSLPYIQGMPGAVFVFALLLACLALPATTALPLGDYPRLHGPLTLGAHMRRWLFLAAKCALLIPLVYFSSIALAYGCVPAGSAAADFLQFPGSFLALLLGFRWILQDQRRRCPKCLRLLSNPARVGQPSCNFLAWNGTELFCARGHGLLHIPELPTSWFSTQRWLCLDPSWECLFTETGPRSAEIV
ncbi:MAG TPA: hypothetical protein VHZ09_15665 [Acidobacteriaceae bacterium]|jgi:hypothetical protein|nr:hypothetical protein [Acidobacteriaceae bacterium]